MDPQFVSILLSIISVLGTSLLGLVAWVLVRILNSIVELNSKIAVVVRDIEEHRRRISSLEGFLNV